MTTFFDVLIFIAVALTGIALFGWAMAVWGIFMDWRWQTKVAHSLGAIIALAAFIAFCINSGLPGFVTDDNAAHCGPGTRYISESHYNPATKTTITDWMCTA